MSLDVSVEPRQLIWRENSRGIHGQTCSQEHLLQVSRILGVKSAEFDVVIAFGLLHGLTTHFSDADSEESARKPLYVRDTLSLCRRRVAAVGSGVNGSRLRRCVCQRHLITLSISTWTLTPVHRDQARQRREQAAPE